MIFKLIKSDDMNHLIHIAYLLHMCSNDFTQMPPWQIHQSRFFTESIGLPMWNLDSPVADTEDTCGSHHPGGRWNHVTPGKRQRKKQSNWRF